MKANVKRKRRFPSILFGIVIVLLTLWLIVAASYLVIKMVAEKDEALPTLFGYQIACETDGQMKQIVPQGSALLVVSKPNPAVNDIVLYKTQDGAQRVGRVSEVVSFDSDASLKVIWNLKEQSSETILRADIYGQVVYSISYLGYVIDFLNTSTGILLAVILPAGVVILLLVVNLVVSARRRKQEHAESDDSDDVEDEPARRSRFVPEVKDDFRLEASQRKNEELDRVWDVKKYAGDPNTKEILTDQDMIHQLSNLTNQFSGSSAEQRTAISQENEQSAQQILTDLHTGSEVAQTNDKTVDDVLKQPYKKVQQPENTPAEKDQEYEELFRSLGMDGIESSELVSMLRDYGLNDLDVAETVQQAKPFAQPVIKENEVNLPLHGRLVENIRIVSDQTGKYLIVQSDQVETKIRLPF